MDNYEFSGTVSSENVFLQLCCPWRLSSCYTRTVSEHYTIPDSPWHLARSIYRVLAKLRP
ncbi:hypothetical protein GE21DRAFT_1132052 [Neurospora crassa]|nr:hypothetical protein GE21DRAFT_1132052 [Neurospora crassa]